MSTDAPALKEPPSNIYILDTNLLLDFLSFGNLINGNDTREARFVQANKEAIAWLFKKAYVVIPHIVLVEVVAKLLQERIDLTDYDRWYQSRYAALNPLLTAIFNPRRDVFLHSQVTRVEAINASAAALSGELRQSLADGHGRRPPRERRDRDPKVLDGIDAQILDEACTVAAGMPNARCWLATNDRGLALMVDDVSRRATTNQRLPKNLFPLLPRDLATHHKQRDLRGGLT